MPEYRIPIVIEKTKPTNKGCKSDKNSSVELTKLEQASMDSVWLQSDKLRRP